MSRGIRLSVLGLYNFNNQLFSEMVLPEGITQDERNTLINYILTDCAELEILFPDYNICKNMIGLWSKFNLPTWERLYRLSKMEYNPIENYDRSETETITNKDKDTHSGNDIRKNSGTDTQLSNSSGSETNNGLDTNTNLVTGYNGDRLVEHDRSILEHSHNISDENSGTSSTTYGKTETITHGETINREGENVRINRTHGNIGVMSSQDMAQQEIDISPKLNMFAIILESFKERFCLMVY